MTLKAIGICLYITFIYWVSLQVPALHALFYPTLGSFSFLFISRSFQIKDFLRIVLGAAAASIVGTSLYFLDEGVLSLIATTAIVITLITRFKLNAPPVLAVAFIPYFSRPEVFWLLPVSVVGTLAGLLLTLGLLHAVGRRKESLLALLRKRPELSQTPIEP